MDNFLKVIIVLLTILLSNESYSCQKLHQNYLDPEVILNKESRKKGIKVLDARAVRSPDFQKFYFVQYKLEVPKEGIVYPMFAMNKPFSSTFGLIYSMDELAISVSGLGDGRKTKAKFSQLDRGFSEAKRCLK